MPARTVAPGLLSWASEIDPQTIDQAAKSARLPFLAGPVALMPDAHLGKGATIGSVLATRHALIPAAVGVDIGCGMVAAETDLRESDLPDDLSALMPLVEEHVPAGMGRGHATEERGGQWLAEDMAKFGHRPGLLDEARAQRAALTQFGTLGSGNHFLEVCIDERRLVWIVLHSGSRGIGNRLAQVHIEAAKGLIGQWFVQLEDPDLAYLVEGTPQFSAYVEDMLWAQRYAMANRSEMVETALSLLFRVCGRGATMRLINCHHNYAEMEHHAGTDVWVTRKGAIRARTGDWGVIPGSMGTRSYIVRGKGNPESYTSCSHGAGRRMSRGQARRTLTAESLTEAMAGRTWLSGSAAELVDEHPSSYKDIDVVMADQADLVEAVHTLRQVFNYKGVEHRRHRGGGDERPRTR